MVVIDELPGITVTIQVAGEVAVEYADTDGPDECLNEHKAQWRSFKYIESKDDTNFSVHFKVDNRFTFPRTPGQTMGLTFYVYIDGKFAAGKTCKETDLNTSPQWTGKVLGALAPSSRPGMLALKEFKFSAVTTVDDGKRERVEKDLKVAKDLGLIQVVIFRDYIVGSMPFRSGSDHQNQHLELAEKSLKGKAISHGTSFSSGRDVANSGMLNVKRADDGALAVIKFKYRSRDALHSELIIPRSPSPQPAIATLDNLSAEEIRRLAAERLGQMHKIKEEGERKRRIKREINEVDLTGDRPRRSSHKMIKIEGGREAVDLTDD